MSELQDDQSLALFSKDQQKFVSSFPELALAADGLVNVFSCAYDKNGLFQGKMYITRTNIAFSGRLFTKDVKLHLSYSEFKHLEKKKTVGIFSNAIRIHRLDGEKFLFTSFFKRDAAFSSILFLWKSWQAESNVIKNMVASIDVRDSSDSLQDDDSLHQLEPLNMSLDQALLSEQLRKTRNNTSLSLNIPTLKRVPRSVSVTEHYGDASTNRVKSDNDTLTRSMGASTRFFSQQIPLTQIPNVPIAPESLKSESGHVSNSPSSTTLVECECESHLNHIFVNDTFQLPVQRLYQLLFVDNTIEQVLKSLNYQDLPLQIKHQDTISTKQTNKRYVMDIVAKIKFLWLPEMECMQLKFCLIQQSLTTCKMTITGQFIIPYLKAPIERIIMTHTEGILNQILANISEPIEKKRTCSTLSLSIQRAIIAMSILFLITGIMLASMVHKIEPSTKETVNYGPMIENTQLSVAKAREKIKLFNEQISDMQTQLEKISREFENWKLQR